MLVVGILAEEWICRIYIVNEHPIMGLLPIIGCFSFIYMGKVEVRLKLAAVFLILGLISMYTATISLDWARSFVSEDEIIKGRIIRIERLDDRTELVVDLLSDSEKGRVLVSVYDGDRDVVPLDYLGLEMEFVMEIEEPKSAGNPGGFDYRRYLYGRGIYGYGSIKKSDIRVIYGETNLLYRFTAELLSAREAFLESAFKDKDARDLAGGILFGMGRNISDDVREEFMEGGAGHILAVSGLHIGILYSVYKAVEKRLRIKSVAIRKVMVVSAFLVYGTLALWSVSVTRAVLLILIKEFADIFDLRFDGLTALAIASDIMLLYRPYLIFATGFQMSFLAILGLCFMRPKIVYLLKCIRKKHRRMDSESDKWISAIATMISVQVMMIPYTIYVYNRFAVLTLLNNWIMIALAGIYVPLGVTAFAVYGFFVYLPFAEHISSAVSSYIGISLTNLGSIMIWINKALLMRGRAVMSLVSPKTYLIVGIIAGVFYFASEEFKIKCRRLPSAALIRLIVIVVVASLFAFVLSFNPLEFADEVFLDVGQGDSLHINWGETDILIDGGGNQNYNVGRKTLRPYLLRVGAESLDMAISTHEHTDHFLGIEELSEVYPIEDVIRRGRAGERIVLDDDRWIDILWPIPGYEDSEDENYYSRIFKVFDSGITTLVTGDITEEGEKALIRYYRNGELKSHILKVAHHGSRFSSSSEFLDAVDPIIAVISVGKNNYGHPAPSVIEKLQSKGIIVYRTDIDGAIGIIIGDGKFFVCGNRRNMRIEEYRVN